MRFNDTRRSVWVAFTKDDYALAKSMLVGRVSAEKNAQEEKERGDRLKGPATTTGGATAPTGTGASGPSDFFGYVPYDQRLYDSLLDLFRWGGGSGGGSGGQAGSGASGENRGVIVRPRVVVHAPIDLLVGCVNEHGAVAEIAGVGPVSVEVVRRLACDAQVDLAAEDRDGSILDQGRARREPTPVQRIEIDRRDKGCRFPGCSYTEFTNVHHMVHWADGGLTDLGNLITLCGRHHRAVHEVGWALSGSADAAVTFTSPHGRTATSSPSPTWRMSSVARNGLVRHSGPVRRSGPMRR